MPWIDAFAPAEEAYREAVMRDTWGHLAPEKNKSYPGRLVFSFGVYKSGDLNPTILVCDFGDAQDDLFRGKRPRLILDTNLWHGRKDNG